MRMLNPAHPGAIVKSTIEALGLTVGAAAAQLGVNRVTLSRLTNEQAAISPDMALRLEKWLGVDKGKNGPDAAMWLRMQVKYDLAQARKAGEPVVTMAPEIALEYA